jgi:hypothetical protein
VMARTDQVLPPRCACGLGVSVLVGRWARKLELRSFSNPRRTG